MARQRNERGKGPQMPPRQGLALPDGVVNATQDFLTLIGQKEMALYMANKRIADLEKTITVLEQQLKEKA